MFLIKYESCEHSDIGTELGGQLVRGHAHGGVSVYSPLDMLSSMLLLPDKEYSPITITSHAHGVAQMETEKYEVTTASTTTSALFCC